jgi:hypothetical protein
MRTEEFLKEGFKEGKELHFMLKSEAIKIMYEGVNPVNPAEAEGPDE